MSLLLYLSAVEGMPWRFFSVRICAREGNEALGCTEVVGKQQGSTLIRSFIVGVDSCGNY